MTFAFRLSAVMSLLCVGVLGVGDAEAAAVTFNRDIAPLLFRHCAECHRPGQVAPFPLLTFADAAKRAEQIADVVVRGVMPPWKPVAAPGTFANERRLSADEIDRIRRWVAEGAVEGDAADLPKPPTFAEGWQLGVPDLVLSVPEPIAVPADGRDVYMNIILPLVVPKGRFLKAVEFRPGNPRVVHHAVLAVDTTGTAQKRNAASPGQGFVAVSPPGRFLPGALGIWTPGRSAVPLPKGLSMPWPADGELVLNLHLHPSGKPETEQSTLGIFFTDEPPQRPLVDLLLIDKKIDIPPGESAYRTHDRKTLQAEMEVHAIFPHMHLIGRDIRIAACLPDGTTQSLLHIEDWDFNWQDLYLPAAPIRLPKGTEITLDAVHDNSAANPQNPRHPPRRVRWGEESFDEMSLAFLSLTPVADASSNVRTKKPAGENDAADATDAVLRKADLDGDLRLSVSEITTSLGKRRTEEEIRRVVARFDRDGDEHLSFEEARIGLKAVGKK